MGNALKAVALDSDAMLNWPLSATHSRIAWSGALARSVKQHLPLAIAILFYAIIAAALPIFSSLALTPKLISVSSAEIVALLTFSVGCGALVMRMIYIMVCVRPKLLSRYLWNDLAHRWVNPERIANLLPVLILLPIFISSFSFLKASIPFYHPFDWDPEFAKLDRALHFGVDPWRLLQPVLGYPIASAAINAVYHLWFFVFYAVIFSLAISVGDPVLRLRSLVSVMSVWPLLGNGAATIFSSAGPVYFTRVTGLQSPYAPLMDYLHTAATQVPLPALRVQEMLWDSYVNRLAAAGSGLSAMPSLHVATSFMFVLIAFSYRRWLGWLMAVFCLCILAGSVHLAWHYAIDGYAGILGAVLVWSSVGWLFDRAAIRKLFAV